MWEGDYRRDKRIKIVMNRMVRVGRERGGKHKVT